MNNIVLDMVIATKDVPPRHVLCHKDPTDGVVICKIVDKAMLKEIAEFKVSEDLVGQIPQLLNLYIK